MAMFVLRYLHVKDASDFIHSLPIKRHHLFSQQVGFGVVALWIPILLNSGLIFIVSQYLDVSSAFNLTDLGYWLDRKSTRLNSSHVVISYAVFCLNKKIF